MDDNRAGVALDEPVSKPDLRTGHEAAEYAAEIGRVMRYWESLMETCRKVHCVMTSISVCAKELMLPLAPR